MEIIQIVGYKNSGKTTFSTKLIKKLSEQGYRVSALKHHGHGGVPDGFKDTDSQKHLSAGAMFTAVEGEGLLQLSSQEPWDLLKIIPLFTQFQTDILVIEGFKNADYNKMVLIGKESDLPILSKVSNIKAIVTAIPKELIEITQVPIFNRDEIERCLEWISNSFN